MNEKPVEAKLLTTFHKKSTQLKVLMKRADPKGSGMVSLEQFQHACDQAGTLNCTLLSR
jgi:hypothetical protein